MCKKFKYQIFRCDPNRIRPVLSVLKGGVAKEEVTVKSRAALPEYREVVLDPRVQSPRRSCPKRPPQLMEKHEDFISSLTTGSFSIREAKRPQIAGIGYF